VNELTDLVKDVLKIRIFNFCGIHNFQESHKVSLGVQRVLIKGRRTVPGNETVPALVPLDEIVSQPDDSFVVPLKGFMRGERLGPPVENVSLCPRVQQRAYEF